MKQHDRLTTSSQGSREMARDPQTKPPSKPRKLKAVLKKGDDLIEVMELPDYGEVILQMNAGEISHIKETRTRKPIMPK